MKNIKVVIAESNYLIRKGFASLMNQNKDFQLVSEIEEADLLLDKLFRFHPDVLIIDYDSDNFNFDDIKKVKLNFPEINILSITDPKSKLTVSKAIDLGITGHLLKSCGKEEIIEAVYATCKGQRFMCEKIVAMMLEKQSYLSAKNSCDGIKLSDREVEILQQISLGLPNKNIASKLNISIHTVTTHRKNIMGKLKINNTASLVMYAIRENLMSSISNN